MMGAIEPPVSGKTSPSYKTYLKFSLMCVSITLQLRVIIFPKSWLCHVNIVSITSQPVLDITHIVVIVVVVIVVAAGFWLKCFKSDGRNSRTYVTVKTWIPLMNGSRTSHSLETCGPMFLRRTPAPEPMVLTDWLSKGGML